MTNMRSRFLLAALAAFGGISTVHARWPNGGAAGEPVDARIEYRTSDGRAGQADYLMIKNIHIDRSDVERMLGTTFRADNLENVLKKVIDTPAVLDRQLSLNAGLPERDRKRVIMDWLAATVAELNRMRAGLRACQSGIEREISAQSEWESGVMQSIRFRDSMEMGVKINLLKDAAERLESRKSEFL